MPCTLNAVGLLSSRRGDARVANPCPTTSCVCVEKCTLPYLTLPLGLGSQAAGAWEQVGCTSADFNTRKGLTGLGGAPFTSPAALFYCYDGGAVCAKEVLRLFGRPVLLNELRGEYGFSPDGALMQERRCRDYPRVPEITRDSLPTGALMQERFGDADLGGQRSSKEFAGATATTRPISITGDVASLHCERALSTIRHVCITADGAVRVAKVYAADTQSAPLLFAEISRTLPGTFTAGGRGGRRRRGRLPGVQAAGGRGDGGAAREHAAGGACGRPSLPEPCRGADNPIGVAREQAASARRRDGPHAVDGGDARGVPVPRGGGGGGRRRLRGHQAAVVVEDAAASRQAPHCRPCVQGRATCTHFMHMLHAHEHVNMHM